MNESAEPLADNTEDVSESEIDMAVKLETNLVEEDDESELAVKI